MKFGVSKMIKHSVKMLGVEQKPCDVAHRKVQVADINCPIDFINDEFDIVMRHQLRQEFGAEVGNAGPLWRQR
jgi:hypothetical protein